MEALTIAHEFPGGYATLDGDLPVFTESDWISHAQAWQDAESDVTEARWKQAAIAYSLVTHYGEGSVEKFASEIGISPRTVWAYRAAYALVQKCGRTQNLDFTHYVIASSAPDPAGYIERAAEESLSTKALKRLIARDQAAPLDDTLPAISDDPAVMAAWRAVCLAFDALTAAAPRLADVVKSARDDIHYEISLPPETLEKAILAEIRQGIDTIDEIARRLKRDRQHVIVWTNGLVELGKLVRKNRTTGARGPSELFFELATE